MTRFETGSAEWGDNFEVDNDCGYIDLAQIDRKRFELRSTIRFNGVTGLEHRFDDEALGAVRTVSPESLPTTDLASVPGLFRWFVPPYGVHTPAALIHDRLIGADPPPIDGLTDQDSDRFFRFMLADLDVRLGMRWLMWSGVALRTRLNAGRARQISVILWLVLAAAGIAAMAYGLATGNTLIVVAAVLGPIPASLLWGRQYGAGVVAAYFAMPWVLTPTLFALIGYGGYRIVEWILSIVVEESRAGSEPVEPMVV